MASSSFSVREAHSSLARHLFLPRPILNLDGCGLTTGRARRADADGPHDSASTAHDLCCSIDAAWFSRDAFLAGSPPSICGGSCWSTVLLAAGAKVRADARATCIFLAGGNCDLGRMACSGDLYARVAIGSLASVRASNFPCGRPSLLVARRSALAKCPNGAAMVDSLISLSRHVALRHSFGISCLLRPCGLSGVPFGLAAVWPFCSRGSAVCRCIDVDLHHHRLSRFGGYSLYAAARAPVLPSRLSAI